MSDEFSLEKMKINERLHGVEHALIEFKGTMDRINDSIKRNDEKLASHDKEFYGNGRPGLKMQVDRLSQREKIKNWLLGVIFVAVVGLGVDTIRQVFIR